MSVEDFVLNGVLVNDPGRKQGKRNPHVFESVKRGGKVKVLYVEAYILSSWCAEHALPKEFGHRDFCHPCRELTGVIDKIPTGRDSDAIGIFFLRAMVDNHPCINYHSVLGNIWYVQW